jgi:hypothetical protein
MASLHQTDLTAPLNPELLEATQGLPFRASIIHPYCDLSLRPFSHPKGVAIEVSPRTNLSSGFSINLEEPSGITGIFFGQTTDFETCLPDGVIQRYDNPGKKMLTESGKQRVMFALRYGSIRGDFGEQSYIGRFGFLSWYNYTIA